jgi:hypothetical protein
VISLFKANLYNSIKKTAKKKISFLTLIIFFLFTPLAYSDHSTCLKAYNHLKNLKNQCRDQGCVIMHEEYMKMASQFYYEGEQLKKDAALAGRSGYHPMGGACVAFLRYTSR